MCTVLLPPAVNPNAVIKYFISYHIIILCGLDIPIMGRPRLDLDCRATTKDNNNNNNNNNVL